MELLGLALLMFLGRLTVDIIATVKGTTPPHVEKARLKAQGPKPARERSEYAKDKPRLRDVAAVYWGDAMADAIDLHNRRRDEKRRRRDAGEPAAERPGLLRQIWDRITRPAGEQGPGADSGQRGVDVAQAVADTLAGDGPRIACDACGSTLIDTDGGWEHPAGSSCPQADKPAGSVREHHWSCDTCGAWVGGYPSREAAQADGAGHLRDKHSGRGAVENRINGSALAGHGEPDAVRAPPAASAPVPPRTRKPIPAANPQPAAGAGFGFTCPTCGRTFRHLLHPDDVEPAKAIHVAQCRADQPEGNPTEGDTMTAETVTTPTATGDVHDVESGLHECGLLTDDLGRIDTALDTIDEAITNAAGAAERIEAFLASKNVDDCAVGGMASARDMLSADRIKALIEAIDGAKAGVRAAEDELRRLQDLEQQLAGADGSVLNGR